MVVGTIVGASIFVQPSEVSRAVPSFGGMLLVWIVGRRADLVRREHLRRAVVGVSADGRRLRVPARDVLAGRSGFCGAGRCSGACTPGSSPPSRWCSAATPRPSFRSTIAASGSPRSGGILVLSAINYFGVRPRQLVQTALTVDQNRGDRRAAGRAVRRGAHAHRRLAAAAIRSRRVSARARRGSVRVRRLAHGHLRGRGDARSGADDSARADDRHGAWSSRSISR